MSTIGKPRFSHPNKLVVQHEVFLTNKSLVTKMRSVKSSIPQPNREFDRKIENRKKKGSQNLRNCGPALDEETMQAFFEQRINLLTAPALQSRHQGLEATSENQHAFVEAYGLPHQDYSSNQYQIPRTASTREMRSERSSSLLGRVSSPKQPQFLQPLQLDRTPASSTNNQATLLKTQLQLKELEMQSIKEELKNWWHEDFQAQGSDYFSCRTKSFIPKNLSNIKRTLGKENKAPQKLPSIKEGSNINSAKQNQTNGLGKKQVSSIRIRKLTNHATTNPNKDTKLEGNYKKTDELNGSVEDSQRPYTVKLPLKPCNNEFKIRFSSYFDGMLNKQSSRYDTSPTKLPKEDLLENDNATERVLNKDASTAEEYPEQIQQQDQRSSPQIAVTSKTLMHQTANKIHRSHNHNHYFSHVPESSSEQETKWKAEKSENIKADDLLSEEDELRLSTVNPMDIL